jgi:hypothetical protein
MWLLEGKPVSTVAFLIFWLSLAVAWELFALETGRPTISQVVSALPRWARIVILAVFVYLAFHFRLI